jgi:hypothetical protein
MFCGACSKSSDAPVVAVVDAAVATSVIDAAPAIITWSGTYSATPGTLSVPDGGEWAGTKWRGDDASDGIGDGAIAIEIRDGIVSGTIDGPLGPAAIDGTLQGDHFSARVDRKDPKDGGFVGVLEGTIAGQAATGEMHLSSLITAHLLRQATFQLKQGS